MNDIGYKPDDELARLQQLDLEERRRIADRKAARSEFLEIMELCVDALPDPMILASEEGEILLINTQAELLFGYHRSKVIGRQVEFLVPEAARHDHVALRTGYMEHPHVRPMGVGRQLRIRRHNGREIPVEIMLAPVITRGGVLALAVLRRASHE